MRLSTRSRYGARMVLDLALNANDGLIRLSDMADRLAVSVKYLEKLVRELQKAGLVVSKRGPAGGHELAKEPDEITVGEVVRLLEGEVALTRCVEGREECEYEASCLMHWVWTEASGAMFAKLDALTFGDLAREAKQKRLNCDFSQLKST